MASENWWAEYEAGTLTLPAVVQHDTDHNGTHLIWVMTSSGMTGPYSRGAYDAGVIADVISRATASFQPEYEITLEDGTVIQT